MSDDVNDMGQQHVPEPADDGGSDAAETGPTQAVAEAERDRFYDLLLRKTAEFDNYRKRIERERQSWTEGAVGDVVADLLPVIDDLERALKIDAPGEQADAYRKGVELILKRLLDTLKRRGVTAVESLGQPFDPHRHQAVTYEPVDGKADGEIIEEYARGYLLGDRLLRPAMVKVAKA
jgi:molecular chaperone GrpE